MLKPVATCATLSMALLMVGCAPGSARKFKGNPLYDPNFVPIGVGGQNLRNAALYHDAGINLYISIDDITETPTRERDRKPTAEALKILSDLGMYAIVDQRMWIGQRDNPTIVAWISPVDEPDNKQANGKARPLDEFLDEARKFKQVDPTRPFTVCFGQGVINDGFTGRGIERSQYPAYMSAVDFIQYDFYPIANFKWARFTPPTPANPEPRRSDGEQHLNMVGQGVSRIRHWTNSQKPVLAWIETAHNHNPDPGRIATPAQTNCEVWDAMVHGARGVAYFSHDFTLPLEVGQADALTRNKPMLAQLKITNAKLMKLAPIIAAPLASEPAQAPVDGSGNVVFSTKKMDRTRIVLSVNTLDQPATATLPAPGLRRGDWIKVMEENRRIEVTTPGSFNDTFGPYQEHIYRLAR